jgi:hypothetical protein
VSTGEREKEKKKNKTKNKKQKKTKKKQKNPKTLNLLEALSQEVLEGHLFRPEILELAGDGLDVAAGRCEEPAQLRDLFVR